MLSAGVFLGRCVHIVEEEISRSNVRGDAREESDCASVADWGGRIVGGTRIPIQCAVNALFNVLNCAEFRNLNAFALATYQHARKGLRDLASFR